MELLEKLLYKELYKKSFYEFVKAFWSYADPSKFVDSELIEYYCEVFQYMSRLWNNYKAPEVNLEAYSGHIIDVRQGKYNLNLVVPPRHSKSMIFNVLGPLWLWTLHPIKAVSVSHTGALASQMNSKRHSVINSQYFKELYDNIKLVTNTTSFLKDNRGGELYSINRNAFTGYGGDIIINDDLTNAESARKDKEEMSNAWNYYRNTMPSRVNDINKCIIINIQQRLAPNDITGHILGDKNLKAQYSFITLPAIFDKLTHIIYPISGKVKTFLPGDVLWPERFNDYKALRHQVGSSIFETQYLQNPVASDKSVIKQDLIIEKTVLEVPSEDDAEIVYGSHDFPIKEKETSDYLGSVLAYKVNNTIYIKDCIERKMAFVKSVAYVESLADKFPGIIQVIEDKANGSPIIQQLQDKISGIVAYNPKTQSKTQRLESASLYMESKNVVFVKDEFDEETKTYQLSNNLVNLRDRLLNFPYVKNDDIIDAFSMLILYVFMEKRNNVYGRSFNNENVIKSLNIESTPQSNFFINREGNNYYINKMVVDYSKNTLYVIDEFHYRGNLMESLDKLTEWDSEAAYLIDASKTPINFYKGNIIIDPAPQEDFNESVNRLDRLFSNKQVKIVTKNKLIISAIDNFKWSINKDEDVRYISENDGFISNIRAAIKYYSIN